MDDQGWITGEFEGHYAGLPLTASGDVRVYRPNIIRAIIRSPKRTSAMMSADTVADGEEDFDGRRKLPFHQDHIPDAVVVSESGAAVRVALEDVHIFDWYVPASTEDHGRTFGRIQGRMVARVIKPVILSPASNAGRAGWWTRGGDLLQRWGVGALALAAAVGSMALCTNLGSPSGLACLFACLGLYLLLGRGRSSFARAAGCGSSLAAPALLLVALALMCAQFRGFSGCGAGHSPERTTSADAVPGGGGTLISTDAALSDPTAFFATDDHRIYLSEATLFDFNSADLSPGAVPELRKLARLLQEDRTRRVVVEGYADSIGEPAANQTISERRAEAVRRWLVDRSGVSPDQVTAFGRGSANPIVTTGGSRDEQRANRRVEVRPVPARR